MRRNRAPAEMASAALPNDPFQHLTAVASTRSNSSTTSEQRPNLDLPTHVEEELSALANSDLPPIEFFRVFLNKSLEVTETIGGVVWGLSHDGRIRDVCRSTGHEDFDFNDSIEQRRHMHLVSEVLRQGKSTFETLADERKDSASSLSLLLAPIIREQHCVGAVELWLSPEIKGDQQIKAQLDRLNYLLCYACGYMEKRARLPAVGTAQESSNETKEELTDDLEGFLLRLHRGTGSKHVALTSVNEARRLIGCDRISIAIRSGKRANITAVSGQDSVVQRSNLIRTLSELAGIVLATGESIRFTGDLDGLAPQIRESLIHYLSETDAKRLDAVPLYDPIPSDATDDEHRDPPGVFGVFLVERLSEETAPTSTSKIERLCEHISPALFHALALERVFLLPARRAIGNFVNHLMQKKRRQILWATLALALLAISLVIVRVPYRVEAAGRLIPVGQLRVFAPRDAEVAEVYVRGGQPVQVGQQLLRLNSDELTMKRLLARNQLNGKLKILSALQAERDLLGNSSSRDERIKLEGRVSQTEIEIEGLQRQLLLYESELKMLEVRAELAGSVVTFQPSDLLTGRPVARGQLLLEVMDEAGEWRLELLVPASRLGHVMSAQTAAQERKLPVQFVLATMPDRSFIGTIDEMAIRTVETDDGSTMVPVQVSIDASQVPGLTVGADVIGRINCGNKSLLYVLFGDVYEFIRRGFW